MLQDRVVECKTDSDTLETICKSGSVYRCDLPDITDTTLDVLRKELDERIHQKQNSQDN